MNYQTVPSRRIPLLVRGGCGFNKKLRSRRSRRRPGWSLTSKCFKPHSETSLASDHLVRAFSERDHFLMARPPLLCKLCRRGICPPEFIHSFCDHRYTNRVGTNLSVTCHQPAVRPELVLSIIRHN